MEGVGSRDLVASLDRGRRKRLMKMDSEGRIKGLGREEPRVRVKVRAAPSEEGERG